MFFNRILLIAFILVLLAASQNTTITPSTDVTISSSTVTQTPILGPNTEGPAKTGGSGAKVVGDTEGSERSSEQRKKDFARLFVRMFVMLTVEASLYTAVTRRLVQILWLLFLTVGTSGLGWLPEESHKEWVTTVLGLFAAVLLPKAGRFLLPRAGRR